MILLLGGTGETAAVAEALASAGHEVLVSTATEIPLRVGDHPGISHRQGRLTAAEILVLIREKGVRAIVDATHPYAEEIRKSARHAAETAGVYYATFIRPEALREEEDGVRRVASHEEAAAVAAGIGRPLLLTVGVRNLEPYVREASRAGVALFARVLPHPDSLDACRRAGIPESRIIAARGPFGVEENRRHIRERNIGALVTKDGGVAGGAPEKREAARLERCLLVVVARPPLSEADAFDDISYLTEQVSRRVGRV